MKRFLQMKGGKTFLHLLRKKQLATFAAVLCLMAMMPLTAKAETINIVSSHEELTKTSTVYVGEVVVDGVSEIKYLYSSDVTLYSVVRQNLLDGLNGMADGDYADLLAANWPNNNPPEAFAFCSDATLAAAMDANWSSALYVGMLYFSDKTVASEINSNMYDIDNGFKAALDAQIADRMATIDTIIEAEKCIVSILDATARNIVYYKVVDGEIIKYIHTLVTYSAEATTVIYTKVELETPMTETPLTLEAISDGEITFVYENPYLISLTDIEYQKNGGEWTTYTWNDPIAVVSGDKVAFRGNNETYSGNGTSVGRIVSTADVYVYGNVMSLIHAEDFATNFTLTGSSNFASLFRAGFDYTTFSTIPNTTIQNHPIKDIVLPATTLTNMCYMGMFSGCQGLTRAPELPATEMTVACYAEMFSTTGLTQAPVLPCAAMTPYSYDPDTWEEHGSIDCYMSMFQNCVNLTEAPALPATTLTHGVYQFMFNGCTSLTTAPELPATDLTGADMCYTEMFEGCISLEEAPELPATTLDAMCYAGMFSGCTSLTEAPALPATTLAEDCYHRMFEGCTSLTAAPELPAATLIGQCYGGMFDGCTSLQYVKCLATDLGEYNEVYPSVADWLSNVAPTGSFIKAPDMEDWPLDSPHGIPEGWTTYDQIFQTEGDWNVAANWNTNAVPAAGSNVVIEANATIPSDYIANVGSVFVDGEATLTIEDGGQLYHNNTGVMATVEKNISAYNTTSGTNNGWHLIGYSFAENGAVEGMTNLLANEYDLYYYDEPTHYWKNYKNAANNFTELEVARGYLYANNTDVTLGLTGTLRAATEMVTLPLSYTDDIPLAGFNLVGNPFAHNVTSFTGTNIAAEVYRMNDTKDNLMVSEVSATNPLLPSEGFFVKATDDDASITFNSRATDAERSLSLSKGATLQLEISQNGLIVDRFILKRDGAPLEKLTLNENSTRIFATEDGEEYAVAVVGRDAMHCVSTETPVHFKAAKNGTYTLTVNVENLDLDYLHLIDNLTGEDVDLLQTPEYTFTATTMDYASRFRLLFSAQDEADGDDAPFAYYANGEIRLIADACDAGDACNASLQVVDVMGRVIVSHDGRTRCVPTTGIPAGVYMIRLVNGNNVKTQKIVIR